MHLDTDRIDDTALAILILTLHDGHRVWKGLDWQITDRLHRKGLIDDARGKAKSIALTDEGLARAERMLAEIFGKPRNLGGMRRLAAFASDFFAIYESKRSKNCRSASCAYEAIERQSIEIVPPRQSRNWPNRLNTFYCFLVEA